MPLTSHFFDDSKQIFIDFSNKKFAIIRFSSKYLNQILGFESLIKLDDIFLDSFNIPIEIYKKIIDLKKEEEFITILKDELISSRHAENEHDKSYPNSHFIASFEKSNEFLSNLSSSTSPSRPKNGQ